MNTMETKFITPTTTLPVPNVQALASNNLKTVPSRYIRQALDHEILANNEIPVINLGKLTDDDHEELAKFHLACQDWGFFQVVNHGVGEDVIEKMIEDVGEFFELPLEEKKSRSVKSEGYGRTFVFSEEQKLDWGDMYYLHTQPVGSRNYAAWPTHRPLTFRETVSIYSLEMDRIKTILVGVMAKNLGINEGKFTNMFNNGTQSMRMNYYPPCPEASKVLGISPHSDATGLTVLLQFNQVHGLQINHNGTWVPVKMLPSALLVNIGDIIEILTNGKYKSIEHRVVVSKEKARMSVATFHETHESVVIGPLPELIINGETEQYKHVTFVEFFKMFLSRKLDGKSFLDDLKLKH
ncbi:hypothetical protein Scep_006250 [Stephania cephalantha]|uniref:Fe2OG dioxygenase domain-containing protein n=1 Tax=Stephania cephalantha TaxID=152367 RepID=A0AAP0K7L9_9MAGN